MGNPNLMSDFKKSDSFTPIFGVFQIFNFHSVFWDSDFVKSELRFELNVLFYPGKQFLILIIMCGLENPKNTENRAEGIGFLKIQLQIRIPHSFLGGSRLKKKKKFATAQK